MTTPLFITGIDTGVGKTIVSAVVIQSLGCDYWKPIQAGDLERSDTQRVASLVSRNDVDIHPETYRLTRPMSPHAAAEIDGIDIRLNAFQPPRAQNRLVIEGAGGLMVPLNDSQGIIDLIEHLHAQTVVVSKNYLGSINHTLLTIEVLRQRNLSIAGLVFCGKPNPDSESIIVAMTGVSVLARIPFWERISSEVVREYSNDIRESLSDKLSWDE